MALWEIWSQMQCTCNHDFLGLSWTTATVWLARLFNASRARSIFVPTTPSHSAPIGRTQSLTPEPFRTFVPSTGLFWRYRWLLVMLLSYLRIFNSLQLTVMYSQPLKQLFAHHCSILYYYLSIHACSTKYYITLLQFSENNERTN